MLPPRPPGNSSTNSQADRQRLSRQSPGDEESPGRAADANVSETHAPVYTHGYRQEISGSRTEGSGVPTVHHRRNRSGLWRDSLMNQEPELGQSPMGWRSYNNQGMDSVPWPASWNASAELQSRAAVDSEQYSLRKLIFGKRTRETSEALKSRRAKPVSSTAAAAQRAILQQEQQPNLPAASLPARQGYLAVPGAEVDAASTHGAGSYSSLPPGSLLIPGSNQHNLANSYRDTSSRGLQSSLASRMAIPPGHEPRPWFPQRIVRKEGGMGELSAALIDAEVHDGQLGHESDDTDEAGVLLYHASQQDLSGMQGASFISQATGAESEASIAQQKQLAVAEEKPSGGSSFAQTTFNAINIVAGIALLSMPYSVAEAGASGLLVLLVYAAICTYTGYLLRECMDAFVGVKGYPDIGWVAFGTPGRIAIGVILYIELFMVGCELLILGGGSLTAMIPHPAELPHMGWAAAVRPQTFWVFACSLAIMPTMYMRDLTLLSYLSAAGIMVTLTIVMLVTCESAAMPQPSHLPDLSIVRWHGMPLALGIYAFCYSGHAVFPSLYNSMKDKSQYPRMLIVSIALVTVLYIGTALVGFEMYGGDVDENIVVGMRVANKKSIFGTLASVIVIMLPLTKFALTVSPVAEALEELLPVTLSDLSFAVVSRIFRTMLVVAGVAVALSLPFFAYVAAIIGSIFSVTISVILPTACYISINRHLGPLKLAVPAVVGVCGIVSAACGTYVSVMRMVHAIQAASA